MTLPPGKLIKILKLYAQEKIPKNIGPNWPSKESDPKIIKSLEKKRFHV